MKKYLQLIFILLISLCVLVINTGKKFKISYYDNVHIKNIRKANSDICDNIILDLSKDAYVLNEFSLRLIQNKNLNNYLTNGGLIIVNDTEICSDIIYEKFNVENSFLNNNVGDLNNYFGFYVYNNGINNKLVNVITNCSTDDNSINNQTKIDRDSFNEKIINYIVSRFKQINSNRANVLPPSVDYPVLNEFVSEEIENIIYKNNTTTIIGSYTTSTEIYKIARIKDENNVYHTIYDVLTNVDIYTEEDYALIECCIRMNNINNDGNNNNSSIIDTAYLNSDTETLVSFAGTNNISGTVIEGSYNLSYIYSFDGESMNIYNDNTDINNKYWHFSMLETKYNENYLLKTSFRMSTNNDVLNVYQNSRLESCTFIEKKLFSNQIHEINTLYSNELRLTWNCN